MTVRVRFDGEIMNVPQKSKLLKGATGDWDRAHKIVMADEGADAAWVHAYLHRVEGDLPNARYWYRTAGKPIEQGPLEAEWNAIVAALLAA